MDKIVIEHLFLSYSDGTESLRDINLHIPEHSITVLFGPAGGGKSTLLRVLNRLNDLADVVFVSGKVLLDGVNILAPATDVIALRRKVGMVFARPVVLPFSIRRNLTYGLELAGVKDQAILEEAVERSLFQAALWDEVKDRLDRLAESTQRSKSFLAAEAIREYVANNEWQVAEIREFIKSLAGERTIILSTHILPEVSMTCERVIIIHEGQIAAVDTPDNLMKKLQKTSTTVVLIKGPAGSIREKLQLLPGVIAIGDKGETSPGVCCFEVEATKESEISGELAQMVYLNSWKLVEMRTEKMSLEKIFIELTREESGS